MATNGSHGNDHRHVGFDEADWEALAADTELQGELLISFVTDSARRIAELRIPPDAPPVERVFDIGCGPGVGTCELARLFPDAHVVAVDGSPAMLDLTTQRAAAHGLDRRITTLRAEVPDGLDHLGTADVIWASMALHHIGDETNALRVLGELLEPSGLLAIAEGAEPMRILPDDLDIGQPGFTERLNRAESNWFAAMRAGLSGSVSSTDLVSMVTAAGLDVVDSRIAIERFDPPLSSLGRQVVLARVRRARQHLDGLLEGDDLRTLDVLSDPDDPRSVMHRGDVFVASSRQIVVARRRQHP
jgi:SAM-dependent methyltransferase